MFKLFHGKEPFLSLKECQKEIKKLQQKYPSYTLVRVDADDKNINELVEIYSEVDMFSSGKIIVLKRVLSNKDSSRFTEEVMTFMENSSEVENDQVNLVFWEDSKVRSNTRFYKFFNKRDAVEEVKSLNKRTFITWAKHLLREYEIDITTKLLYDMAARSNYDPERFNNEVQKITLAVEDGKIDKSLLEEVTVNTLEYEIWGLLDALNSTDSAAEGMNILNNMIEQKVEPLFILAMISRNLRHVLLAKYLKSEGKTNSEICSLLRIPPFTLPKILKKSKNYSYEKIKFVYNKINNLDYEIKRGKIDSVLGLTLLFTIL